MGGIAGPGGVDALVLAVGALLSLPAVLEVVVAAGEFRPSDLTLVTIDVALVVGALVLLSVTASRSWFAVQRATRG